MALSFFGLGRKKPAAPPPPVKEVQAVKPAVQVEERTSDAPASVKVTKPRKPRKKAQQPS